MGEKFGRGREYGLDLVRRKKKAEKRKKKGWDEMRLGEAIGGISFSDKCGKGPIDFF
jgi:hypothetical protein